MSTIEKALAKQRAKQQTTSSTIESADSIVDNTNVEQKPKATTKAPDNAQVETFSLNKQALLDKGFIFDATTDRLKQEEFRNIKRKLLNNAFGAAAKTLDHSNLIMVSSANPNEGKTFVSINLALSIALEQDKTVLLVDADVLRPSITRELELPESDGLMEYLLGDKQSIREILYHTDIENLRIIPAGRPHHLTNELLASDRMAALASELAERYPDRVVIFDCPPILGVTETPVLSNLMGQAIIVTEESKTKIADINAATSQLNQDLAMGLVVNKTLKSSKDTYGYYGYGYGSK